MADIDIDKLTDKLTSADPDNVAKVVDAALGINIENETDRGNIETVLSAVRQAIRHEAVESFNLRRYLSFDFEEELISAEELDEFILYEFPDAIRELHGEVEAECRDANAMFEQWVACKERLDELPRAEIEATA